MPGGGAIHDFDLVRFGGPTVPAEGQVLVGTTATRLLSYDPDRLQVTISNNDAGPVYIGFTPAVSVLGGRAIGSGIALIFQVQNDGALCGQELWAIAPGGPFTVNYQLLRRGQRG